MRSRRLRDFDRPSLFLMLLCEAVLEKLAEAQKKAPQKQAPPPMIP